MWQKKTHEWLAFCRKVIGWDRRLDRAIARHLFGGLKKNIGFKKLVINEGEKELRID